MKNNINEKKNIKFDYLEYDINSRIKLFKNLLDSLNNNDDNLKELGYEIVDSKLLLELLRNNFKKNNNSMLLKKLDSELSKEVNRYSEFEKKLRKTQYFVSYKINYNLDNDTLKSVILSSSNESDNTNLNEFLNNTKLFRGIINSKIDNKKINEYAKFKNQITLINEDVKKIYLDFTDVSMDNEHFIQLKEIISLRKKVFEQIQLANAYNFIINYDFDNYCLRDDIKYYLYLFVAECTNNILNIDEDIDSNIEKIKELINLYKSKKMILEDNNSYDIYSDIIIPEELDGLLKNYYFMYEDTVEKNEMSAISFLSFLKITAPAETELIKLVSALTDQFNTIYSEYLIYKTPIVKGKVSISFEQFAKIKYGINSINTNFVKK